jgi:hypothetical protein
MLFFFTLGSSMVGDICDEDDLKTGQRTEGSFYSIFWWFIKMGTALASFVAGALIVFTMFDQTQVTKVDSLQGSIRELQVRVQAWVGAQSPEDGGTELIGKTKLQVAEALKESRDYAIYLDKELLRAQGQADKAIANYQSRRMGILNNALSATKTNINELEQLQYQLETQSMGAVDSQIVSITEKAIPLTLQTRLEKARVNSFELLVHLEAKSLKTKTSEEHYQQLMQNIIDVNNRLGSLNTSLPLQQLDVELSAIETEIVSLTQQSPYTLLLMRVVEIGLPLLLSIFSVFFILRYTLTEKRSHEIKALLKQRNEERIINENEPTTD